MKGKSAVLGLVVAAWAGLAMAQDGELTGVYRKEGGELAILQGDNETLLYYGAGFSQGQSVGTCECPLVLQKKDSPTRWSLKSVESEDRWTLKLEPERLSLSGGSPECCGAGWSGDAFSRQGVTSPRTCKVKAPRAHFHAADEKNTRRKAFVVAGDAVQAFVPSSEPELVPARFAGKRVTVGLLRREQLDCQASVGSAASASAVGDVSPIVGKWARVARQGKKYARLEYCFADNPTLEVRSDGVISVQYGQEGEELALTSVKPGAAGAYTLEVKHSSGDLETLRWKVVDAKQGIVQVTGDGPYFDKAPLYIRDDKARGLAVRKENCDEYE